MKETYRHSNQWNQDKLKMIYNKTQLRIGKRIEMEHTKSKKVATKIAKDHLDEFPNYYTALIKMEKKLKQGMKP